MTTPVKMPALGESITEGTITRWLKQEGDRVEADEPLFEVSTDKVDTEVPSPVSGTLQEIKVGEDQTAEVGAELAVIATDGEGAGKAPAEEAPAEEAEQPAEQAEAEQPQAEAEEEPEREERPAATAEGEEQAPREQEGGQPPEGAPETEATTAAGEAGTQERAEGGTTTVTMPALGESITEGTITRWLKQQGDRVEADEPLFEVSTDKVDTEVPSPVSGTLQEIKVGEDQTAEVGAELAVVATGDGAAPAEAEKKPAAEAEAEAEPEAAPAEKAEEEAEEPAPARAEQQPQERPAPARPAARRREGDGGGVVSPLVRKLVREHGVDLSEIQGTGAGGRVRRQDVLAYVAEQEGDGKQAPAAAAPAEAEEAPAAPAEAPEAAPAAAKAVPVQAVPLPTGVREEVVKASRIRRIIAERMVSSLQTSAQLTAGVEIDMTKVMRLRARVKEEFKQREGINLSPLPFAVMALVGAVREHPMANAALDADFNLHIYKDVNLGVAVDTPKGLYNVVIRNVDRLNLTGIAHAIADVAARTRAGKVSPQELSGSTISITNTGSVGAVWDTPILNMPNACMFATPAIVRRPVVMDDPQLGEVVAVRHMMNGVLTYDHRIIDGADAARFLGTIKRILEAGDFEQELGLEREA